VVVGGGQQTAGDALGMMTICAYDSVSGPLTGSGESRM
jgi:hypothetical protein